MKNYILLLLLTASFGFAQNTLHYNDEKGSPKATLQNISWISGNWIGEALGGICEENWSKPIGNSMMFNFKLVKNGKVVFYELGHIIEKDNTLLLQLKHFGADLKGWERPEISEEFRLVKVEENKVFFNQFTFEKVSDNEMNIYVVFEETGKEMKFNYKK